ncbi:hypothetical protein BCR42DRAFT_448058 [Absidia repens]|uniref:HCP-like protein n=1 Tax=Absidia repens TaxID=90262 RepID=A0A1X2IRQ3_9FUNG|nr:hypothetical protein BCR42DRAFT_448058 [Absidia repens]
MTLENGFDNSPLSTKSNYFPFLSSIDTLGTQRKPKAIRKLTKTFSNLSMAPTRQGLKSIEKGKPVDNHTRTPSIASIDSDFYHSSAVTGKMTLRVLNPDPVDSSEDEEEINTTTFTKNHVTPAHSILTQDNAIVGATSNSTPDECYTTVSSKTVVQTTTSQSTTLPNDYRQQQQQQEHLVHPSTATFAPKLVRRQSKTLDEYVTSSSTGYLPPIDLTPFDSSHFMSLSSTEPLQLSSSPYIRLSATIEPAPALATPVNATPAPTQSSSFAFSSVPAPPQPQPSISNTTTRADQSSVASFDRNTLTTLPGDGKINDRRPSLPRSFINHMVASSTVHNGNTSAFGKLTLGPQPTPSASKYIKASYSLTNHPDALLLYRDMAKKTGDKMVQYTYAKYLLEIAALYDQGRETKHSTLSSIKYSLGEASQRLRQELAQATKHSMNQHSRNNNPSKAVTPLPSATTATTFTTTTTDVVGTGTTSSSVDFSGAQSTSTTATSSAIHTKRSRSSTTTSMDSHTPSTMMTSDGYSATNSDKIDYHQKRQRKERNSSHQRKKRALEEEGIRWMKRLAKEHMPDAAYTVATWMDESKYGFTRHPAKSFVLYDIAAKAGIRDAVYKMGLYYVSIGDASNAFACIKKASEQGVVQATLHLAKIYLHGELSERQNMTLAIRLLHQATNDADESCPEAPYMFGQILTNTYPKADVPSQVVEQYGGILSSLPYFEKAVQLGYPPAHSTLGSILEQGLYGLRMNYAQCYMHYTESAKRGDAQGMIGLSRLNNRGVYGPDDEKDAFLQKLALDESGWLAQRQPNEEKAFYWCQKAADQELPEAQFLLGWYYEIGLGTPRDHEKSQWYYLQAATNGNQDANQRLLKDSSTGTPVSHHPTTKPTASTSKKDSPQCALM